MFSLRNGEFTRRKRKMGWKWWITQHKHLRYLSLMKLFIRDFRFRCDENLKCFFFVVGKWFSLFLLFSCFPRRDESRDRRCRSKLHHKSVSWIGLVYFYRQSRWWLWATCWCDKQWFLLDSFDFSRFSSSVKEAEVKVFVWNLPWWWLKASSNRIRRQVWCPKARPKHFFVMWLRTHETIDSSCKSQLSLDTSSH